MHRGTVAGLKSVWRHQLPSRNSFATSVVALILLQKSKIAEPRIFRENTKREKIADSHTLNRVAEAAREFNVRRCVPSRLYTKAAPTARRIFDHRRKTTFATVSS
jgi:hypothetical protein